MPSSTELRDLSAIYNPYSLQRLPELWPDVSIIRIYMYCASILYVTSFWCYSLTGMHGSVLPTTIPNTL